MVFEADIQTFYWKGGNAFRLNMGMMLCQELKTAWDDPVRATLIQRDILNEKFLLRQWYEDIYRFVSKHLQVGPVNVELGSGSSFLYKHIKGLIKTNIIVIPDNDMVFDACFMPFKNDSIDNLILISVFHHLSAPEEFLQEAVRVLKPKGRILISDPYISALSYALWHFLHPEGCDLSRTGFDKSSDGNPVLDANSANATLMFVKKNSNSGLDCSKFKIIKVVYHTICHYWLAGGYNLPPLMPKRSLGMINLIEKLLSPFGSLLASFMYVVIEKG